MRSGPGPAGPRAKPGRPGSVGQAGPGDRFRLTARQQPTRAHEFASRLTVILPGRGRGFLSPGHGPLNVTDSGLVNPGSVVVDDTTLGQDLVPGTDYTVGPGNIVTILAAGRAQGGDQLVITYTDTTRTARPRSRRTRCPGSMAVTRRSATRWC